MYIVIGVFVGLLILVEAGVWYFRKEDIRVCGGVAGRQCLGGFVCQYTDDPTKVSDPTGICIPESEDDTSYVTDDLVEYSAEAFGETCPLDVKFLVSRRTEPVGCRCPDGYELNTTIIGGEECYDGAECIIAAAQCEALEP